MNSPYGLEMVEDCVNCTLRRQSSFCSFSPGPARAIRSARSPQHFSFGSAAVSGRSKAARYLRCLFRPCEVVDNLRLGKNLDSESRRAGRSART